MNLPTFKIRDSEGEPSDHEAVHVVYVRELWAEKERLLVAGKALRDALAFECHKIGDVPREIDEWDALVSSLSNPKGLTDAENQPKKPTR